MLAPGMRLTSRYVLEAPLGSGGMATVWRALDTTLDRRVAVKVPREGGPQEFADRLRHEALAAATLTHPSITGVYDYGEADTGDDGRVPFVVMELLEGESLKQRLDRGPLTVPEAADVGARLADALAAAHAVGLVHRDVKPANVHLTPTGVKVLDFGIAFSARKRTPTTGGPLLGTPKFLAPEVREGADPAPSADVYALGVTLAAALGGGPEVPPGTPDEVAAIIRRCLAERPEDRPSADQVASDLRRAVPETPAPPPTPAPAPAVAAAAGPPKDSTKVLTGVPYTGQRKKLLLLIPVTLGVLGLVALILGLQQPDEPRRAATPPPSQSSSSPSDAVAGCSVAYSVSGRWPGGFQVEVRVTNLGDKAIKGWTLTWAFSGEQQITQLWNGSRLQRGRDVTVIAAEWNRDLGPNGTAQFGFLGSGDAGAEPRQFKLNGAACRAA